MHEAYEISQLLKLTVQIESISAYDDNLLVGTRQGHLLMYSISQRAIDQKNDVQLLRYNKTFSKKPIQQLEVIPDCQLLVCLTDNIIVIHDMNAINFPVVHQAVRTKGATLFTLDIKKLTTSTGNTSMFVRVCVAVKRKLQLYYWKNNELLKLVDDISLNDVPKALAWCEETICVGFRGEYTLFEMDGKKKELFPTSSNRSTEPYITKISDSTFAVGRENQTVLVNTKGETERTKALRWSDAPTVVVWDNPYTLGLLPDDTLEVHTVDPCGQVQTLTGLTKARLMVQCKQGLLYAASISQVWCIRAIDIGKQRPVLLNNKQFQLALKLTNISDESEEDKKEKIYQIQTLYAYDLFESNRFHESMAEFFKLGTDPYDVIKLFPDLLPAQNRGSNETNEPVISTPKLQNKDLENGLLALIDYLTEVRFKIQGDTKSKAAENSTDTFSSDSKSNMQLLQIIDTTLLKCYLQTNDALIAPLLRLNYCHLNESERILKKHEKYSELIILYQTKGQHKRALELLQKQANEPDSSLNGYDRTIHYLQELGNEHIGLIFEFASWVLDAHPEEGLKIFTEHLHEENLSRPRVLDFLLRTHKLLVIPYLEHVVKVWEDTNPLFHNALIHQYREKQQQLLSESATSLEQKAGQHIRTKLLTFLEESTHYTPETVLVHFPYDCLYEERAIILGRMGHHEQALAIYVLVLGDIPKAIQYCKNVAGKLDVSVEANNVFISLIKMLLSPNTESLVAAGVGASSLKNFQPDLKTALSLLDEFADKIPAIKVLPALPKDVPLSIIHHFLETSLHTSLSERRRTQVLKGLLYAEHLQAQELRMMYEMQSIVLTELKVCPICKKRFGNQSAFVRSPNGEIVHYSCQDRRT